MFSGGSEIVERINLAVADRSCTAIVRADCPRHIYIVNAGVLLHISGNMVNVLGAALLALLPNALALSHMLEPSTKLVCSDLSLAFTLQYNEFLLLYGDLQMLERMTASNGEPDLVANGHRIHMRCEEKWLDSRDPRNYCSEKFLRGELRVGDLCLLRPQQVNPTQSPVGKGVCSLAGSGLP